MDKPDIDALLVLQDVDTRMDQERHRRAHLPERAEMAEVERAMADMSSRRGALAAALAEVAGRQEAAESELRATEQRVRMVNQRLFGGTVSASRELQVMSHDVEGLRKRASDLEDRILAMLDEREPLDAAVGALDEELADLEKRHAEMTSSTERAEAEIDEALAGLAAERAQAVAAVPAPLLATYERLRAKLGGVAVARLVGGRCDGCHLALPAMELDRVLHHPSGTLEYCEQCGRILVVAAHAV